jgi:protein-tyrosine phosphatase
MSEILPQKLYLGSLDDAMNIDWIKNNNIKDVITVITGIDTESLTNSLSKINVKCHVFDICDTSTQNLSSLFQTLFDIIDSSTSVLVHCGMGISRSATVVLAYLMYSQKMYLDDAMRFVLKSRLCIFPNDGFIVQLIEFENKIFGSRSFLPDKDGLRKFKMLIHSYEPIISDSKIL